jgi:hypothetical protein
VLLVRYLILQRREKSLVGSRINANIVGIIIALVSASYKVKSSNMLERVEKYYQRRLRSFLILTVLSTGDLAAKILDFIAYYNDKIAKPFQWTYKGKVLTA